jgi:hypothetical protein
VYNIELQVQFGIDPAVLREGAFVVVAAVQLLAGQPITAIKEEEIAASRVMVRTGSSRMRDPFGVPVRGPIVAPVAVLAVVVEY